MKTEIDYGKWRNADREQHLRIEAGLFLDLDDRRCGDRLTTRGDLEGAPLALPSHAAGVDLPLKRIRVTGRRVNWKAMGPRIRVRVTFDSDGDTSESALGWLWV